jgi:hypothetical protein
MILIYFLAQIVKKVIGNHVITFIMEGYTTMSYTIDVSDDGLDAYFTFPDLELLDAQ